MLWLAPQQSLCAMVFIYQSQESSVSVYLFVSCPVYLFYLGIHVQGFMCFQKYNIYVSTWVLRIKNIFMLDNDITCSCRVLLLSSPFPCSPLPLFLPLSDQASQLELFKSLKLESQIYLMSEITHQNFIFIEKTVTPCRNSWKVTIL